MQLTIDSLRAGGGFTGPPVKRQIHWERDGETITVDVYVRRLSFHAAVSDARSAVGTGDVAVGRIVHSICDASGKPVFTAPDITGINADGTPVLVLDERGDPIQAFDEATGELLFGDDDNPIWLEQGPLDGALTIALLNVIGEVNSLGKQRPTR